MKYFVITTVIGNLDPACMLMFAYRNGSNSGTLVKKHTCALCVSGQLPCFMAGRKYLIAEGNLYKAVFGEDYMQEDCNQTENIISL